MIQIIKGIIFGKNNSISQEIEAPQSSTPLLATNQDPNHQREILRKEAQIAKKTKH